jgi:hypothetical protein
VLIVVESRILLAKRNIFSQPTYRFHHSRGVALIKVDSHVVAFTTTPVIPTSPKHLSPSE